jgi:hypothetical protein
VSGDGLRRRDHATGLAALAVLLIVVSPVWLVLLLGLAAPLLIAALLVLLPIAFVRQLFVRAGRR